MAEMSEGRRERIMASARATTYALGPGVMPPWVANKPWCRWAWENKPKWRRMVENVDLPWLLRRDLNRTARTLWAAARAAGVGR